VGEDGRERVVGEDRGGERGGGIGESKDWSTGTGNGRLASCLWLMRMRRSMYDRIAFALHLHTGVTFGCSLLQYHRTHFSDIHISESLPCG